MDKEYIHKLLISYVTNTISESNYIELMNLVEDAKHDKALYGFMEKVWNSQPVEQPFTALQSDLLYRRIVADQRFAKSQQETTIIKRPVHKIWYKVIAAASVFIALCTVVFFSLEKRDDALNNKFSAHDISPGGNKATLTLGNGKKISLTDLKSGTITQQSGIVLTKTAQGELIYQVAGGLSTGTESKTPDYNIIETPAGGQYQVNLPDGTKVWLNAASGIKFLTSFTASGKRKVELSGEAYFEVARNEKKPFVVVTNDQEIEVLGTHFNVNTYTDEPVVKTTLLEGSVRVFRRHAGGNSRNQSMVILKPGQESVLSRGGLTVHQADVESAMAWKNGLFFFKDEPLSSIVRKISRWYDVEISYPEHMGELRFEGEISRFKTVSEVLRKFKLTENINYKIEGRRITIMP